MKKSLKKLALLSTKAYYEAYSVKRDGYLSVTDMKKPYSYTLYKTNFLRENNLFFIQNHINHDLTAPIKKAFKDKENINLSLKSSFSKSLVVTMVKCKMYLKYIGNKIKWKV